MVTNTSEAIKNRILLNGKVKEELTKSHIQIILNTSMLDQKLGSKSEVEIQNTLLSTVGAVTNIENEKNAINKHLAYSTLTMLEGISITKYEETKKEITRLLNEDPVQSEAALSLVLAEMTSQTKISKEDFLREFSNNFALTLKGNFEKANKIEDYKKIMTEKKNKLPPKSEEIPLDEIVDEYIQEANQAFDIEEQNENSNMVFGNQPFDFDALSSTPPQDTQNVQLNAVEDTTEVEISPSQDTQNVKVEALQEQVTVKPTKIEEAKNNVDNLEYKVAKEVVKKMSKEGKTEEQLMSIADMEATLKLIKDRKVDIEWWEKDLKSLEGQIQRQRQFFNDESANQSLKDLLEKEKTIKETLVKTKKFIKNSKIKMTKDAQKDPVLKEYLEAANAKDYLIRRKKEEKSFFGKIVSKTKESLSAFAQTKVAQVAFKGLKVGGIWLAVAANAPIFASYLTADLLYQLYNKAKGKPEGAIVKDIVMALLRKLHDKNIINMKASTAATIATTLDIATKIFGGYVSKDEIANVINDQVSNTADIKQGAAQLADSKSNVVQAAADTAQAKGQMLQYTVEKGDTLSEMLEKTGLSQEGWGGTAMNQADVKMSFLNSKGEWEQFTNATKDNLQIGMEVKFETVPDVNALKASVDQTIPMVQNTGLSNVTNGATEILNAKKEAMTKFIENNEFINSKTEVFQDLQRVTDLEDKIKLHEAALEVNPNSLHDTAQLNAAKNELADLTNKIGDPTNAADYGKAYDLMGQYSDTQEIAKLKAQAAELTNRIYNGEEGLIFDSTLSEAEKAQALKDIEQINNQIAALQNKHGAILDSNQGLSSSINPTVQIDGDTVKTLSEVASEQLEFVDSNRQLYELVEQKQELVKDLEQAQINYSNITDYENSVEVFHAQHQIDSLMKQIDEATSKIQSYDTNLVDKVENTIGNLTDAKDYAQLKSEILKLKSELLNGNTNWFGLKSDISIEERAEILNLIQQKEESLKGIEEVLAKSTQLAAEVNVEVGAEITLDSLQASKEILKQIGIDSPTPQQLEEAAKILIEQAKENGVKVTEEMSKEFGNTVTNTVNNTNKMS